MMDMAKENYKFWKMAWDMKAIDIDMLRQAVKTEANPYGEISPEQFKVITNVDFIVNEESKKIVKDKTNKTPREEKVTE